MLKMKNSHKTKEKTKKHQFYSCDFILLQIIAKSMEILWEISYVHGLENPVDSFKLRTSWVNCQRQKNLASSVMHSL